MRKFILGAQMALLVGIFLLTTRSSVYAETYIGTNIDSRVIVGLSVDAEGVQELLPEGWTSAPFPGGPLKGSNLLVSFVDGLLMVDAEGKPLAPASRRAVILVGLAKQAGADAVRTFVMSIYTSEPENDPYGLNVAAEITRTNSLTGPAAGGRQSTDAWRMAASGGELAMSLNYTTGLRSWSSSEALSYSAAPPDFYRIYRYDSVTDLAMSTAVGKPLAGAFSMTNSVPELAAIFNGDEQVVAILDIPVRSQRNLSALTFENRIIAAGGCPAATPRPGEHSLPIMLRAVIRFGRKAELWVVLSNVRFGPTIQFRAERRHSRVRDLTACHRLSLSSP